MSRQEFARAKAEEAVGVTGEDLLTSYNTAASPDSTPMKIDTRAMGHHRPRQDNDSETTCPQEMGCDHTSSDPHFDSAFGYDKHC